MSFESPVTIPSTRSILDCIEFGRGLSTLDEFMGDCPAHRDLKDSHVRFEAVWEAIGSLLGYRTENCYAGDRCG